MNTESSTGANDVGTGTVDALALLDVPPLDRLSEQKVRGIICVWGGETLTNATAVNLGARKASRAGAPVTWQPRACRRCVFEAAYAALVRHAPGCGDGCEDDAEGCGTGLALRRLMREHRR